uniref:Uncharacterized protein n=1 Tax=Anguilla anguilla TaxID=7936 RepID=A0A0E9UL23_ANGAN
MICFFSGQLNLVTLLQKEYNLMYCCVSPCAEVFRE